MNLDPASEICTNRNSGHGCCMGTELPSTTNAVDLTTTNTLSAGDYVQVGSDFYMAQNELDLSGAAVDFASSDNFLKVSAYVDESAIPLAETIQQALVPNQNGELNLEFFDGEIYTHDNAGQVVHFVVESPPQALTDEFQIRNFNPLTNGSLPSFLRASIVKRGR